MWLDLVDKDELKDIPSGILLSDNGVSIVTKSGDMVYKRSIPFMIENELWCLQKMYDTGFVPYAERYDKYTIEMELIVNQLVTDKDKFLGYRVPLLEALESKEIYHGDITKYAILVNDNRPYIIDFAESRILEDPRPSKRPKGDEYWIWRTFEELCNGKSS